MAKAERNGKRKSRAAFQTRRPDLGHYYVVTDTRETEKNYIQGLRDSLPDEFQKRIVVRVSTAKTQQLVQTCKELAASEPQYAEPWIVLDRDQVKNFDAILAEAEREDVHVAWSNPCIEVWFEAYFGKMPPYSDSVSCCKGYGATYRKNTGKEYRKEDKHIYATLNRFGDQAKAIQLAEQRLNSQETELASETCSCTTMHRLVQEIIEKTRAANTASMGCNV